ncbi:MAG: hypothetical protein KJZ54_02180 [Phycisphaerales bacterium]|nr:hypothetical protein [Phycisphaerales bacterium]
MTAEIAILNRSAVAMAADSAVTMRLGNREKIFPTANKIFALSKHEPVGIMVYGGADFMSVPWETIVKVLRQRLGNTSFQRLTDYADWFRKALADSDDLIVGNATDDYVYQCVAGYFMHIQDEVKELVDEFIEEHKEITKEQVTEILHAQIEKHVDEWKRGKVMPGITKTNLPRVRAELKNRVERIIDSLFSNVDLSQADHRALQYLGEAIFTRHANLGRTSDSGVVIAGFGTEEIVPALTSMEVRGRLAGVLQWRQLHEFTMEKMQYGVIVPFAQTDEVQSFLDGVHPDYQRRLNQDFEVILDRATDIILDEVKGPAANEKKRARQAVADRLRKEYDEYTKKLKEFRQQEYSHPILHVLAGTPKDQLAAMAEAMVNITSFKRRVSTQAETVGGPIDVALISKGDGLVWVKRKHYFPAELNRQFFMRYNQELP